MVDREDNGDISIDKETGVVGVEVGSEVREVQT